MTAIVKKGCATAKKHNNDRRQNTRFSLSLPVRYCFSGDTGWGQILNISSAGALLTIGQACPARGELVELHIGWPVLLEDRVHLNLVAKGAVVRVYPGQAAVRFGRCDLRTSSSVFLQQAVRPLSFPYLIAETI